MMTKSTWWSDPSLATLRTKLRGLDFEPGILNDVFMFMKEKVKSFSEQDKECQLVIDEMSIIEGNFTNYSCLFCPRAGYYVNVLHDLSTIWPAFWGR